MIEKDEDSGLFLPGRRRPGRSPQDFLIFLQQENEYLCALPEIAATMLFPNNEISRGLTFFSMTDQKSEYLTRCKFWWKYIQKCEIFTKQAIVAGIIARTQHVCYQSFPNQSHKKGKSAKFAHYIVNNESMKKFWSIIFNSYKLPISHSKKIHTEFKPVLHFLASFVMIKSLIFSNKFCNKIQPSDDDIIRTFLAFSYEHYMLRKKHGIDGWLPSNFYKLLEMFEIDRTMAGLAEADPIQSEFLNRELDKYINEKAYLGI